jgi:ribonuclease G
MPQEILVNVTPREIRIALVESGILHEIYLERSARLGLLGNIYKGKINRLLPGIQAAFVDIGLDRSAFLHVSDLKNVNRKGQVVTDMVHADIRDFLTAGHEIFVQVYKNPLGSKGARLTTQFTIPSRYLVFTPGVFQIVVSQKIEDENERERLANMITPSQHGGYIFRTAATGVDSAAVIADKEFLDKLWNDIAERCRNAKVNELVYAEVPLALRIMRDLINYADGKIRVDDRNTYTEMRDFAERYMPSSVERIEYYADAKPIFDLYSVEEEIQKALESKVNLKSGGHVVFDQTEAMTTIDVNTGSYLGHMELEHTVLTTNLEAVQVIARQVRLRNLGGIIIIDFIDMTDPAHQALLLQTLNVELAKDSVKTQVSELSSLGLVQMTRKRTHESLEHVMCVSCPYCQGRGSIKSRPTVCYEIFRDLKRVAQSFQWEGFVVKAAPDVIEELMNEEAGMLADIEAQIAKPIKLKTENFYTRERYDILPFSRGCHLE